MTDFSILDLVPVREGGTVAEALAAATDLAVTAEQAGCKRFWVAEHHAMEGIAGGATSSDKSIASRTHDNYLTPLPSEK